MVEEEWGEMGAQASALRQVGSTIVTRVRYGKDVAGPVWQGRVWGRSNDNHEMRWNIDTMYYDTHSEVGSAVILRLPQLR